MSARREILMEAADLVDGDRNVQYGDPIDDFRRTAAYWSIHIGGVLRRSLMNQTGEVPVDFILSLVDDLLAPHDVAIMMAQLKQSRMAWSPNKRDSWADMAGYTACGWDCVERETEAP